MRRVLVDYARRRGAAKRRAPLVDPDPAQAITDAADAEAEQMVALDEALSRLAALDARQSRVVEYRYFVGLTEEEIAGLLGVSSRTVRSDWVKAKAWLYQELHGHTSTHTGPPLGPDLG
jgi:RNA polymerase sigma factor (TIGR02999 family)